MYEYVFFGAFGLTVLFGTACSIALICDRRRKSLRQRLAAISSVTSTDAARKLAATLNRPLLKPPLRGSYLVPTHVLARLSIALVATGGSIGIPGLILTGTVAAGTTIAFAHLIVRFSLGLAIGLGAGAAFVVPTLLVRLQQTRYRRQFLAIFPDALDLIARSVRAGLPVLESIDLSTREIVPPVSIEFRRILDEMRVGVEMEDALQQSADRVRLPDFRFFAVCLILQQRTGGSLAETLANLSILIRQRRALHLKSRALTAEARTTAVVLSIMPLIAGAGLFFINRQIMSSLIFDPRGRYMLIIAIVSLLLGITIMTIIIRRGTR